MKKIFAIALIGLVVAFSSNAIASDNDCTNDIQFVIGENVSIDAVAFEFVPVVTEFTFNVAVSGESGKVFELVSTDSLSTPNFDVPIDYGIRSTNINNLKEFSSSDKPILSLNEFSLSDKPIPNLTNYVNEYNKPNGYASFIKDIAANVGKFTRYSL